MCQRIEVRTFLEPRSAPALVKNRFFSEQLRKRIEDALQCLAALPSTATAQHTKSWALKRSTLWRHTKCLYRFAELKHAAAGCCLVLSKVLTFLGIHWCLTSAWRPQTTTRIIGVSSHQVHQSCSPPKIQDLIQSFTAICNSRRVHLHQALENVKHTPVEFSF